MQGGHNRTSFPSTSTCFSLKILVSLSSSAVSTAIDLPVCRYRRIVTTSLSKSVHTIPQLVAELVLTKMIKFF